MKAWELAYQKRQWDVVENWWRSIDDAQDLKTLLDLLRRDVPRIKIENGMETDERHMHPNEVSEEWRGGAEILYLGELEAKVTGDPPEDLTQWNEVSASTVQMMQEFLAAQEVTEGDRTLSRRAHAEAALELLSVIEREAAAMCAEIDPDGDKPDDRAWLAAVIAQTASAAFKVGVHARAALGKEIEQHAVRGKKNLDSAKAGGKATSASTKAMNTEVLKEMKRLIASGHSVSGAARLARQNGLGTSNEGNRKIYQRHGPKKK